MCRAVTCQECGKTTWAGCGEHVDGVRRTVPAAQWCEGDHPAGRGSATPSPRSFLAQLFGR